MYSLDTKIGTLLDDPKAKTVLDRHFPGGTNHPMVWMARGMTLNTILAMPEVMQYDLTKEKIEAMLAEINLSI